ncbi:unnamed protein product [Polarella glacialis]|uniref:Uncharacterized protein n=1 Tax=Polarella glacialis TaxID=89957 RepID=A0A813FCM2_POLGL|nr:unnamed protein product [Polarella glacialis]CAE8636124.1 unnamed protein product [Polarella glacialis]CAE8741430.1 unnamed protein product [Polarella glacialis]
MLVALFGCVTPCHPGIKLVLRSLEVILEFLIREFLADGGLAMEKYANHSVLRVTQQESAKFILRPLIASGLAIKRDAAEVALGASSASHAFARRELSQLVGRQNATVDLTNTAASDLSEFGK